MCKRLAFIIALVFCASSSLLADTVNYVVTVNTSSIADSDGWLDFNFGPGLSVTSPANAQVSGFSSGGTLAGSPVLTGDAGGTLDSSGIVTLDNGTAFNDYFEGFTFGDSLTFDISLYGPALTSPPAGSTSPGAFAFSMFAADGSTPVLTSDPSGYAVVLNVNPDGTVTPTDSSSVATVSAVPEPPALLLLGMGFLAVIGVKQHRLASEESR